MGFGDVFDDGEAESGSASIAAAGAVGAVEAFEDSWEVFGFDAAALIGDFDDDFVVIGSGGHGDGAVFGAVFDGVVEEVDYGLFEEGGVELCGEI